jgi:hypothetical protein
MSNIHVVEGKSTAECSSTSTTMTDAADDHLSYPTFDDDWSAMQKISHLIESDKLYVGNLSPDISMYVFSPYSDALMLDNE